MKSLKDIRKYTYTTGAHITPHLFPDGQWRWVVTGFEDDTFCDGQCISVYEIASTETGLFQEDTDE